MKILALDPATKCGWAHSNGASGVWDLSVRRDESDGMRIIRLIAKLNEIHAADAVQLVAFEAARAGKPGRLGALVVSSELQGAIKTWCLQNKVEYRGYSPAEIKKFATGSGRANKDDMIEAAIDRFGKSENLTGDEADAMWLLELAKRDVAGVTS